MWATGRLPDLPGLTAAQTLPKKISFSGQRNAAVRKSRTLIVGANAKPVLVMFSHPIQKNPLPDIAEEHAG